MSIFNGQRLTNAAFKLDIERMRRGWYSDKYFTNIATMLAELSRRGYTYQGYDPRLPPGISPEGIHNGDIEVEMQWFTRRPGKTIVVGVDKALTMLRLCTGYWEGDRFHDTSQHLQVWAVQDVGESGVDVGLTCQMRFTSGTMAQIYCGFRAPFVQGAQFVGSDGVIRIQSSWIPGMSGRSEPGSDTLIELTDRAGHEEKIVIPASNPWQKEVEAMEACVIDGAKPVVPLSLSREFLKSALALYESARTGKLVEL